jgi:hypothetical protein
MVALLPVSGCVNAGTSGEAFCAASARARADHAAALAIDAGPRSLATGAYLIDLTDAACD